MGMSVFSVSSESKESIVHTTVEGGTFAVNTVSQFAVGGHRHLHTRSVPSARRTGAYVGGQIEVAARSASTGSRKKRKISVNSSRVNLVALFMSILSISGLRGAWVAGLRHQGQRQTNTPLAHEMI